MEREMVVAEQALETAFAEEEPKLVPTKKTLTEREDRFVEYYTDTFNKVESYRKAFNCKYLTEDVVRLADELMVRPEVDRKIKAKMSKLLTTKLAAAPHWILAYIQEIMDIDPSDYLCDDGINIKPLSEIRPEIRKFLRQGKPTVNNKTGTVYGMYEVPSFASSLDKLIEIFKLAATLQAQQGGADGDTSEVAERRARILSSLES